MKEEDKKAGGVVDFDESVEVVAGHLYSTVNKGKWVAGPVFFFMGTLYQFSH